MKRPSFQFYPGDWQSNSNLKRCTRLEKSVWLDVLCLMHDQEEYGVLRWTLKEIAEAAHCKISELKSLHEKGVLKGADKGQTCAAYVYTPRSGRRDGDPVELIPEQQGPIWYSSRFVRDEYVRTIRGAGSRFGESLDDSPELPFGDVQEASPKPTFGDGASSSSSSSSSKEKDMSGLSVSAREVLAYLNSKTGRHYQPVEANTSLIRNRIKDGATVDQCKAVIDAKHAQWAYDPKMSEYLRPATLFRASNFAQYLGALGDGAASGYDNNNPFADAL